MPLVSIIDQVLRMNERSSFDRLAGSKCNPPGMPRSPSSSTGGVGRDLGRWGITQLVWQFVDCELQDIMQFVTAEVTGSKVLEEEE